MNIGKAGLVLLGILAALLPGCDSGSSGGETNVDLQGRWRILAIHQVLPLSRMEYTFTIRSNSDDVVPADARLFLGQDPVWAEPKMVEAEIQIVGDRIVISFKFPGRAEASEKFTGDIYLDRSFSFPIPGVRNGHYRGSETAPPIPTTEETVSYDTDNVTMTFLNE